ncbi:peroxisomal membrane protein PEX14 isoform X2 [Impatiens glandulifera]|uniref:peroxisomal membrane protein PEX14 isoform X2 n=1 Tax=Impatiens glandulifera TaxID=253017 RepID=UPI001FB0526A|nr:peroxisomal membrane protein PEX14 isoform X2 [Impatiens glandulifera]
MTTPSPPTPTDNNPQVQEAVQPTLENQDAVKSETVKEISPPSVFVNREPIREDQVQNAVKFLSHPKVRGSAVMYRRSFLEQKGLTKEEIDEAFSRVPDPSPTISSSAPGGTNQDAQIKSSSNFQPQAPSQALQPAAVAPAGTIARLTSARFHWTHALLAVGFVAVSGAGTFVVFKNAVIPRLKSWIRKVVLEEDEENGKKISSKHSIVEEAAAAAKDAASAATDVARASQEMLLSKNEERKFFENLMQMLDVQVKEMKLMNDAIRKLEGSGYSHDRIPPYVEQDHRGIINNSRQLYANGKVDVNSHPVRAPSPPAPVAPSPAPHPQSYMDIMSMIQRGEKPSNIKEIDDKPPNPHQPLPNASLAPRTKPWETNQAANNSSRFWSQESNLGVNYNIQANGQSNNQKNNARITEIENDEEEQPIFGPSAYSSQVNNKPVQRSWVPPQAPPVLMPEAAAAIRQPKKIPPQTAQKQTIDDDKLASSSSDLTDELQKITKISELGGGDSFVEQNSDIGGKGGSSGLIENEIQEVEEDY